MSYPLFVFISVSEFLGTNVTREFSFYSLLLYVAISRHSVLANIVWGGIFYKLPARSEISSKLALHSLVRTFAFSDKLPLPLLSIASLMRIKLLG